MEATRTAGKSFKSRILLLFFCLIVILAYVEISRASVIRVPEDYPTIQDGIDAAEEGDTVLVADGIYSGEGNMNLDFHGKDITVNSNGGPENCVIDGLNQETVGFYLHSNETEDTLIEGFTIRNFRGAGIYVSEASPEITHCVLQYNISSNQGGGMHIEHANIRVSDCIITDNAITGYLHDIKSEYSSGGGMWISNSNVIIENSKISGNTVQGPENNEGGGIEVLDSELYLENCQINNNYVIDGLTSNTGGGICNGGWVLSSIKMVNCIVIGNYSDGWAGGIYGYLDEQSSFENCLIAENEAYDDGGLNAGSSRIINCTITDNNAFGQAGDHVGGVRVDNANISNSIIWGNSPENIVADGNPVITYSNIEGGWEGEGNIDADPLFVTGSGGDYYLSQIAAGQALNSPCVDSGSDQAADVCFETQGGKKCMDDLTTRTDDVLDYDTVDMGYHFVPGTVATTTPTPIMTPSPTSTFTSTVTPTPPPLGVTLEMPGDYYYSPGQICWLKAYLGNDTQPLDHVPLFVILDVFGEYWFWDDWTHEVDYVNVDVPVGHTEHIIIEPFTWPDTGESSLDGIRFWSALTDQDMSYVLGGNKGIGLWEFGYGP